MLAQVGVAFASTILTFIADVSRIFCSLTIAFEAVLFVNAFTAIPTGAGRAFVDVHIAAVTLHDVITSARHAAADVDVGSHKFTQLTDEFSCPYVTPVPAL